MVGEVSASKSSGSAEGFLLRPAAHDWQRWRWKEEGPVLEGTAPDPGGLPGDKRTTMALPVRRIFSLAVWLPAGDPSLLGDLVFTQLEMRGLASRTRETTVFSWRVVATQEDQVLVAILLIPHNLDARYWQPDVVRYQVSAACLPLGEDLLTVWMEEGAYVLAATRGGDLVHCQSLVSSAPGEAMRLEIELARLQLEAAGVLPQCRGLAVLHDEGPPPDPAGFSAAGGPPVRVEPFPSPRVNAGSLDCLPLPVQAVQARKARLRRYQWAALAVAAVYFILVAVLALHTAWLHWKVKSLESSLAGEAPTVEAVRRTMEDWGQLEPAIDPATYPLEILFQAASLLPAQGVRFTLFEMQMDRVLVSGEAANAQEALKLGEGFKNLGTLSAFEWQTPYPKQLPNGSWKFQFEGIRHGAPAAES